MHSFVRAALCAGTFLAVPHAFAATQVFEATRVSDVMLPKFDGSLGTLTSVTFENQWRLSLYIANGGSPLVKAVGTLGYAGTGELMINEFIQAMSINPDASVVNVFRSGTQTYTDGLDAYLAGGSGFNGVPYLYVGFGNPLLSLTYEDGATPETYITGVNNSDVTSRVTFTYDPAAAVPEPSTWALMLAGFGMAAYAMRRRPRLTYAI